MKRKITNMILVLSFCLVSFAGSIQSIVAEDSEEWNVMDKVFTNYDDWRISSGGNDVKNEITQNSDYINIATTGEVTEANLSKSRYYFLVSPTNLKFPTEDDIAVEVEARIAEPTDFEANEISIRASGTTDAGGRISKVILKNATEDEAAHIVVYSKAGQHKIELDVSEWNTYKFIIKERDENEDRKFDFYVNGEKKLSDLEAPQMKGGDLIRMGHDNSSTSSLDVRTTKVKANIDPEITGVTLENTYVVMNQSTALNFTAHSLVIKPGSKYQISMLDKNDAEVSSFTPQEITSTGDNTEHTILVPEELASGKYKLKIDYEGTSFISDYFFVVNEEGAPTFPKFAYADEPVIPEDHTYKSDLNPNVTPSEWNFPSIIDTHKTPLVQENSLVDSEGNPYRYYLFYAPHNDPGGIMLMTSQSLDGPWVDYEDNPFIENSWADGEGGYYYKNVPHVSSSDVMFNEDEGLFFMYFHGNNTVTRYATSPDLINWTYGDIAVSAKDFNAKGNEASYARVYEHEIDGLGNKYVMLLMINDNANVRKIYWAYSKDGKDWTAVTTPLADPLVAPEWIDYSSAGFNGPGTNGGMSGANLSGPFLMNWQDRWFLLTHGSNGDVMVVEVGENFDQQIHWGPLYDSVPGGSDLGRAGAAVFMQDDDDCWHMFYEGGLRLRNNILHAKEAGEYKVTKVVDGEGTITLSSATAYSGARVDVDVKAKEGYELTSITVNGVEYLADVTNEHLVLNDVQGNLDIKAVFEVEKEDVVFVEIKVKELSITVEQDTTPEKAFTLLQKTVTAVYSDGSEKELPITGWDYSSVNFSKPGKYEAVGVIDNDNTKTIKINVKVTKKDDGNQQTPDPDPNPGTDPNDGSDGNNGSNTNGGSSDSNTSTTQKPSTASGVNSGDTTNMQLYLLILAMSSLVGFSIFRKKAKSK